MPSKWLQELGDDLFEYGLIYLFILFCIVATFVAGGVVYKIVGL